ncbi:ribosome 60S biogenesis N-terminal-domain-containing protein, partial [Clohesyomyces aquaticus]
AVYAKRDFTLEPKVLSRNISLWKEGHDQRKPSIRINAVRYLLAHLKYQDEFAKAEILSNTIVVRALFDHLHADPPFLVLEILDVMSNHVFLDKAIPRRVKSRILTGKTLSHIASLYRYQPPEDSLDSDRKTPDIAAHEFLCLVCTSPACGVMLPSTGFYAPAGEGDDGDAMMEDAAEQSMEFGFDPAEDLDGHTRIRNVILAEFIQSLRPYASTLQQELLIAIFTASPELVANYFLHKESFHYDPKLTSTWVGYSAFLYQTIEIPVPTYLGGKQGYREYPPPVSAMIQSILPQPLNQQVLTRCLNHSSDLVNFFAIRVIIVAFNKLRAVLSALHSASVAKPSSMWEHASKRLVTEFCQRCPQIKAVILAFRRPAFQKDLMREGITRLLRLYYEVTPQLALQEKFDVSIPLCNALVQAEKATEAPEDKAFRVIELEHWIQIATQSASMRWWQKNKSLQHSPFMTLLKLLAASPNAELYVGIKELLVSVLQDHDMLQMETHPDGLDVIIASLGASCGCSAPSPLVLDFLDDCCSRFIKGPIKYFDDYDAVSAKLPPGSSLGPMSPLVMTLLEQWPFKGGKSEKGNPAEPIAHWLSKLLYLLKLVGEDETVLGLVRDSFVASADKAYQDVLRDCFLWKMSKEKAKEALKSATSADFSGSERSSTSPNPPQRTQEPKKIGTVIDLELPPEEDEKHAGLNRWRKKDLEECIDDGDIGELLLCLCSKHAEIRLQAAVNIRQLIANIEANKDQEFTQLRLLLGETLETVERNGNDGPLPYVGGVFAARAVNILADPTHVLFGKVNKFLLKRPYWFVDNIPRYFGRNIVRNDPEQDDSYHKEVDWFLDYVIDCLRTSADMEIFRIKNIFEGLLSYYESPSCAITGKEKILRLLFRAAAVGGSTTLITRCGIVSWIQMRLANADYRHEMLTSLAIRVYDTSDKEKVGEWSSGIIGGIIAQWAKSGGQSI